MNLNFCEEFLQISTLKNSRGDFFCCAKIHIIFRYNQMNSLLKNQTILRFTIIFSFVLIFALSATRAQDFDEMPDPVKLFNLAQEAHEKGDLETALKLYGEALETEPEFPEAEYQRGTAYLQLNKFDEAEKSYRRALEIRENWTLAMSALGNLLVQKGKFAEAETLLSKAIRTSENNFPAFAALADLYIKTNAATEILQNLLKEIKVLTAKANPTASIWISRARLERRLDDPASAKQSLKKASEIDAGNKIVLSETAEIAVTEGDFDSALQNAKRLADLSPDSVSAKLFLANIYGKTGNISEAEKLINTLDPKNAEVVKLKKLLSEGGSDNIAELEKTLEIEKNNAAALARLCVLTRTENPQKSLEYCRKASELEPKNINHAIGYAAALVQQKNYLQAGELLYRLKEIAPDNFTLRANLATALFQSNKFLEAKTEYLWLTEKQPDLAIAYYFLGIVHDRLQEYPDAMANYQQFLRLADEETNSLEIDKVNLRIPTLQKQIKKRGK